MANITVDARESGTSTGRYVDKLIEHMHALKPDYDITVITSQQRAEHFRQATPNFKTVKSKYFSGTFGEQYGFVWQLYGIKSQLTHFSMIQQPVLYFGNSVTTIHDLTTARYRNPAKNRLIFGFKQFVYKRVIRRVAKKSKLVITPSEFVKNDVAQFTKIDPAKIIVTYEAADKITESAEPIKELVGDKFIMYVGRAQPHKNLERLLEAFALLKENHPELKLVLAGKKDILYAKLEKRAKKLDLTGVVFTGFVSEHQLRWLYENCAAYVFPSLSEGFGLPGLEAMLHGAPVVSSNETCLPEIYGNAALYFDPINTDDMADKISRVLDHKETRQKLVKAGKDQAAKYSWQKTAKQTLEIYKRVINT